MLWWLYGCYLLFWHHSVYWAKLPQIPQRTETQKFCFRETVQVNTVVCSSKSFCHCHWFLKEPIIVFEQPSTVMFSVVVSITLFNQGISLTLEIILIHIHDHEEPSGEVDPSWSRCVSSRLNSRSEMLPSRQWLFSRTDVTYLLTCILTVWRQCRCESAL